MSKKKASPREHLDARSCNLQDGKGSASDLQHQSGFRSGLGRLAGPHCLSCRGSMPAAATRRAGTRNPTVLALKLQESPQLIAIVDLMRPHPSSDYDALGLLILHRTWQGKGLGLEAAGALENVLHLVVRSREVLASPAKNPAKRFPTTLVEWKPAPSLCAIGKMRINPS